MRRLVATAAWRGFSSRNRNGRTRLGTRRRVRSVPPTTRRRRSCGSPTPARCRGLGRSSTLRIGPILRRHLGSPGSLGRGIRPKTPGTARSCPASNASVNKIPCSSALEAATSMLWPRLWQSVICVGIVSVVSLVVGGVGVSVVSLVVSPSPFTMTTMMAATNSATNATATTTTVIVRVRILADAHVRDLCG